MFVLTLYFWYLVFTVLINTSFYQIIKLLTEQYMVGIAWVITTIQFHAVTQKKQKRAIQIACSTVII